MAPFARFPGAPDPEQVLFIEAFGRLSRDATTSDAEDLYSVFNARGNLMGWSAQQGSSSSPRFDLYPFSTPLWSMHEGELTFDSSSDRIGFVQVGVAASSDIAAVLPALLQCFDDSLRRFGALEMDAVQLTGRFLQPGAGKALGAMLTASNWFNATFGATVDGLLFLSSELADEARATLMPSTFQRLNTGSFALRSLEALSAAQTIAVPMEAPPDVGAMQAPLIGVTVTLPEWTASAIGWLLAVVLDELRYERDVPQFALRLRRR
jgi:hypothetical protein